MRLVWGELWVAAWVLDTGGSMRVAHRPPRALAVQ